MNTENNAYNRSLITESNAYNQSMSIENSDRKYIDNRDYYIIRYTSKTFLKRFEVFFKFYYFFKFKPTLFFYYC